MTNFTEKEIDIVEVVNSVVTGTSVDFQLKFLLSNCLFFTVHFFWGYCNYIEAHLADYL